jgi:hypothetical protein
MSGETGGLEKMKSPFRYLIEKSTKSLCQPQDSDDFCFLDLSHFCSSCAIYSDKLVTLARLSLSRT